MRRFIVLSLLALLLTGCSQEALFERFVPQEESALAKELIAKMAAKDFAAVESRLAGPLKTPDLREKLEQMSSLLPPEPPKSVKTVGANTSTSSAATTYNLTYEYEYPDRWIIATTVLERRDGQLILEGIHFMPSSQSLAATNAFTFKGKGIAHYTVFALAIAIPLFIVYALFVCARTKLPKRKWLWLLFVAAGVVQFQFDWTSGAWGVQPISFALLGAGFAKAGPVAPYVFTLAFPLGAIVFLLKRRSMLKAAAVEN
ncbi:MAG: hypothetical protein O9335_01060 [Inhella sp.]|jgi:hypothetical protein|uniref:hypothetical protein n=1 Tax=Inhella sp. TaxID=1921806 RepID=UPI0022C39D8B|nr:hypothetical protein [Inhella sp.]MCZ8233722.1 hypothetical protein [Inhella sp.]